MRYFLLALLIMSAGCAEVSLYDMKNDCGGHYKERETPASYPCNCCRPGQ